MEKQNLSKVEKNYLTEKKNKGENILFCSFYAKQRQRGMLIFFCVGEETIMDRKYHSNGSQILNKMKNRKNEQKYKIVQFLQ